MCVNVNVCMCALLFGISVCEGWSVRVCMCVSVFVEVCVCVFGISVCEGEYVCV